MNFHRPFFQKFTKRFNSRVAFFIPHSFLFAILLSFAVYLLGIFVALQGPFDMVRYWVNGFWNFLSFGMQLVLLIVAGFSVGISPVSQRILRSLGRISPSPRRAMFFITALAALCSWIHWGIGILAGSFLARETGRRLPKADYPMLVASAFIGLWAGNFGFAVMESPAVRRAGAFLGAHIGPDSFPQTSLSLMILAGFLLGTLAVAALMGFLCPEEKEAVPMDLTIHERFHEEEHAEEVFLAAEKDFHPPGRRSLGVWLEHSRWPVWLASIMGFCYIVFWFYGNDFTINLNMINFILFILALVLHDTPMHFLKSMEKSARTASGIIVQFPFYAGIQGMLASSGLAGIFFGWISYVAGAASYPAFVYLATLVTNLFAPTAEGIWEVQGALVLQGAQILGTSIPRALLALSAGGTIGNVIHPFWAIPLMGICGLSMRDIMGYCLIALGALSLIWITCLTFIPILIQ
jgi:short-chain fatty acids transporter